MPNTVILLYSLLTTCVLTVLQLQKPSVSPFNSISIVEYCCSLLRCFQIVRDVY